LYHQYGYHNDSITDAELCFRSTTQKYGPDSANEMNLKFLHAQLNPHFFFNMLNNLYGVSLTETDRTPELIVKLSELMRYQIENGNVH
jgi:LytS/YehU family sensor histidine kinase